MMKHKNKLIAVCAVLAVLAGVFWWGGNAPGLRGWTVADNSRQTQTEPGQENKVENTGQQNENTGQNANAEPNGDTEQTENQPEQTGEPQTGEPQNQAEQGEPDKQQPEPNEQQEPEPEPEGGMEIDPATGKDKYNTDPVPEGKPLPVEPQDAVIGETAYSCTLSISCATILDNMDWLAEEKVDLVPEDGWILQPTTVTFYEGESVFNILLRTCKQQGIHMEYSNTPMYNSAYIEGIHNLYEFDCGESSGWMYKVNDWFPNYGCSRYQLTDGDVVEWVYTCDLGEDVGGGQTVGG